MNFIRKTKGNFLFPIALIPVMFECIFRIKYRTFLSFQVILLCYTFIIMKLFKVKFKDLGFNKNNISIYLLLNTIYIAIMYITLFLNSSGQKYIETPFDIILINIIIYLIVGISEELYFRALLLNCFKYKINDKIKIVILSFAFTLVHRDMDCLKFAVIFLISIFLFYLYIKSDSIYVSILFHTLWDLFSYGFFIEFDNIYPIHLVIELIFIILVTVVILHFYDKSKFRQAKHNEV